MSSVYFIQEAATGAIKIGVSRFPLRRLAVLQTAACADLRILALVPGCSFTEERWAHAKFSHLRIGGEWFLGVDELLSFVDLLNATPEAQRRALLQSPPRNQEQALAVGEEVRDAMGAAIRSVGVERFAQLAQTTPSVVNSALSGRTSLKGRWLCDLAMVCTDEQMLTILAPLAAARGFDLARVAEVPR